MVDRGTARAIRGLSPYVAGKTGTTEDAVDGWFIGFTNDVTIAVWVGYDNGDGKRRSLGSTETGARVALPIFEPILQAVWAEGLAPKALLKGPSPEAQQHLIDLPIDYASGERVGKGQGFVEHFRLGPDGRFTETQYQLVSREDVYAARTEQPANEGWGWGSWGWGNRQQNDNWGWQSWRAAPQQQQQQQPQQPVARGLFTPWFENNEQPRRRARRDPDYFWGGRDY